MVMLHQPNSEDLLLDSPACSWPDSCYGQLCLGQHMWWMVTVLCVQHAAHRLVQ